MDQLHSTAAAHRKGQHLTIKERTIIQVRLEDGCTPPQIAEEIGCTPNTVRNEVRRRGSVFLYHGRRTRCKAEVGQKASFPQSSHKQKGPRGKTLTSAPGGQTPGRNPAIGR